MNEMISGGRLFEHGDLKLHYRYLGNPASNDTIVFVHAHSVDSRMWEPQIAFFAAAYRVLVYDMRGYGQSSLPREGEDYLHADDLELLLADLGIGPVHLVGLSLGSFAALDYWALYPDRVRSVTVASGAIPDARPPAAAPPAIDAESFKRDWYDSLLQGCGPDNNGYRQRLREMIGDWSAWQPAHREPECLLRERLIPLLRRAKPIPALVVQSELDFEGAHRSSQKLLDALPYAASIRLKDAGHFPNMETPETFNRELQAFLELKERKA